MNYHIDIQHAHDETLPVSDELLTDWAQRCLAKHRDKAEITLRFVDAQEMTELNHLYRQQNKHTNVLAFAANIPPGVTLDIPLLGDVIICPAVLLEESIAQKKPLIAHWALIVIHGVLHLLGYDHINDHDAEIMQALEVELLSQLGFENPYQLEGEEIE